MKVIQVIPKLDLAGAEIMCENLSISLKKMGVEVIVVSLYNRQTVITERLVKNGVDLIFLNKKTGIDFKIIYELYKVFVKENPDIVHTHINVLQYVAIAAHFANIECCVHTVHSMAYKEATYSKQKIYYLLFRIFNITPVALSEEVRKSIIQRYKLTKEEVPVIYNGIDLNKCQPKRQYSINNQMVFLHIGRFAEVKNHEMLINAFYKVTKVVPQARLKLIGEGPLFQTIKGLVAQLDLNNKVDFLGVKSNVYGYLNTADVFVLPSIYEGMPMTLIEAMGTGLPIIATKVGGIPNMLTNCVNALLIDVNEEAIIEAMIKMTNMEIREHLGAKAKKQSELFSADLMAQEYVDVYKKLILKNSKCKFSDR